MSFDPAFLRAIEIALTTGVAGLIVWAVKKFLKSLDDTSTEFTRRIDKQDETLATLKEGQADQRTSFAELKTALVGLDGQNGINSVVKGLATRVERLEQRRADDYRTV